MDTHVPAEVKYNTLQDMHASHCGLVWLYTLSIIVGYRMPNPFYTYILNIICKHMFK